MQTDSRLLASGAVVAGLALGWTAGCGSSAIGTRATLGPGGGTLSLPSEGVQLEIPAGALSAQVEVALRASADGRGVLVGIEPAQLTLARPAMLTFTLPASTHIASVTEVSATGEQPLGVDSRVETPAGSSARLKLARFTEVRLSTETMADGGSVPGACRAHSREEGDGEKGDGEHGGGDCADGGTWAKDAGPEDAGTVASMECPAGFDCDDGVCVAPGGDDEEEHGCGAADAGACPAGQRCDDGRCVEHADAGDDDGPRDGGHR